MLKWLKDLLTESAELSFDDVVQRCWFDSVDPTIPMSGEWSGHETQGELYAVNLRCDFSLDDLSRTLKAESQRLGRTVELATAYELARYARSGWDRSNFSRPSPTVIALGSTYTYLGIARVIYIASYWPILSLGPKYRLKSVRYGTTYARGFNVLLRANAV